MSERVIRIKEVQSRVGLSRSSIYLLMSDSKFPLPILLGDQVRATRKAKGPARAVGWLQSEIDTWIAERVQQSRRSTPSAGERIAARDAKARA